MEFIDGARETLDIAVQELESVPIAEAIVRVATRVPNRVRVRVVLEHDYLTVDTPADNPFSRGGQNQKNRDIHEALLRARVDVRSDLNPKIFHQKFIVRDIDSPTRAALLTGSTNFTPTGVGSNLNHVVVIKGKRVASLYSNEFQEIWTGTYGTARERHDEKPKEYRVAGIRVKTLFAPDHSPEMELMKQMLKAQHRIDFAIFTFATSSGIDDTLMVLQRTGIRVRGILDGRQGNQHWAATKGLVKSGADIYLAHAGNGLNKLHHKLAVVDDQVVIAGSFNYTSPATALNDENVLVIGDTEEEDAEAQSTQHRIAMYARLEIDRMIAVHGTPVEPEDP